MNRKNSRTYQILLGLTLIIIVLFFVFLMLTQSPWYYSIDDFVIKPTILFTIPLLLVGICTLRYELSKWTFTPLPIILVPLGITMLYLYTYWPETGHPTSWEDSYTTLFIVEAVMQRFFFPLWIAFIVILFLKLRR